MALLTTFLDRMHPRSCLGPCGNMGLAASYSSGDVDVRRRSSLQQNVSALLDDIGSCNTFPLNIAIENAHGAVSSTNDNNSNTNTRKNEKKHIRRKRKLGAMKKLYKLSKEKDNRIPLICTTSFDLLSTLISCLRPEYTRTLSMESDGEEQDKSTRNDPDRPHEDDIEIRRLACLTLNNLSIPVENKAILALGCHAEQLLTALLETIEASGPESHLCVICLYNLSFLEDAADVLLNFCPPPPEEVGDHLSTCSPSRRHRIGSTAIHTSPEQVRKIIQCPLSNDHSLLRVLEALIRTYSPFLLSPVVSVEREAIRWTVGLMSNLAKNEERAKMIVQTDIPRYIVQNLKNTPRPINEWTENSMEELSLVFLCNVIKFDESRDCLKRLDTAAAIEPILGKGGIHDYRAGLIHCALRHERDSSYDSDDDAASATKIVRKSDTMGEF